MEKKENMAEALPLSRWKDNALKGKLVLEKSLNTSFMETDTYGCRCSKLGDKVVESIKALFWLISYSSLVK